MTNVNIASLRRTDSATRLIQSSWGQPLIVDNFLPNNELQDLRRTLNHPKIIPFKGVGTNPKDATFLKYTDLQTSYQQKVENILPPFLAKKIFISSPNRLTNIHCDSGRNSKPLPFKNILYTFEDQGPKEFLVFFRTYSLFSVSVNFPDKLPHSKKFFSDNEYTLCTPNELLNSNNAYTPDLFNMNADKKIVTKITKHIPEDILKHFFPTQIIELKLNRLIIFDSCQLHCSARLGEIPDLNKNKRLILFLERDLS